MAKYDIDGEKYLIIINVTEFQNHKDRDGTESDMSRIRETFIYFNFQILGELTGYVTKKAAKSQMEDWSKKLTSKDPKFLVMVFMSHGKDEKMLFSDSAINLMKLIQPLLMNDKLSSIPKLLLVQLCRGKYMNETAIVDSAQSSKKANSQELKDLDSFFVSRLSKFLCRIYERIFKIEVKADMLICYATASGNYAIRDRSGSSPFIRSFCDELKREPGESIFQVEKFLL